MTKSRSVAIQMDPIEAVDINADSSFVLALEAEARGYRLYHYGPQVLSFMGGLVTARARPLSVRPELDNHFTLGAPEVIDLGEVDVVLMRQDPPFDMSYITATHLLDHIHPDTLVVNDPASVRNAPEKLFATLFPDLMPPTLISRDPLAIKDFRDAHKDIIIKPLYGNGGAGVFHVPPGDDNLNALLEMFAAISREPVMVQAYLADVRKGDKRIILIDGEPAGAINRVPPEGDVRANMHAGGTPLPSELTKREIEICQTIGPELKRRGLIFTGIDVIGDYLTEINVTSPTGIQEINRFDGVKLETQLWDAIEARLR
ncbi:MAG: glutathione synthase [Rhodospirillaceae bacterium]|jgi:glutathione synthase|nr:glutathione synthase [Rhodospirillaceae bacterium]MBT5243012.1 glutathione synthase [Rhodospirillaceae bacterium]MBT5563237.1 glutathione synthase [Rhodospirillaceae bacterium]MBT6243551.1 glutathione synthase [Rhodospirillaceae bacterium]